MYRLHEHPRPKARRSVESVSTPFHAWMINGSTIDIAFPCFYQEVKPPIPAVHHNIKWHHHVGWPNPRHPDHICQMAYTPYECGHKGPCKACRHYIDPKSFIPIHFAEEYGSLIDFGVQFSIDDQPIENGNWVFGEDGISGIAFLDDKEDWIIRLKVLSQLPGPLDHPVNIRFTIMARIANESETLDKIAVVGIGTITVLPSSFALSSTTQV